MGDEKKQAIEVKKQWRVCAWTVVDTPHGTMSEEEARGLEDILNTLTVDGYDIERIDHERNFVVAKLAPPNLGSMLLENYFGKHATPTTGAEADETAELTAPTAPSVATPGSYLPFQGAHTAYVVAAISECDSALQRGLPTSAIEQQTYAVIERIFKDSGPIQASKTLADLPLILEGHRRLYHGGEATSSCTAERALALFEQQIQRFVKARPEN